jgi:hypothetical protein
MYIILEYLTYVALVTLLGGLLFAASATVLVTKEGAKIAAKSSRKLASRAAQLASRHLSALSTAQRQNPQQPN